MNRYNFVCEWFNSSRVEIKKYTLKDARLDMREIRLSFSDDPESKPDGLTIRYLYDTVNALIKEQSKAGE